MGAIKEAGRVVITKRCPFPRPTRSITAQGELVGQNLIHSTYTFENGHKDLLYELKK